MCGVRGALCRERRLENDDGALLEAHGGLYTVKCTVMCTVVYTVSAVYGDFGRYFTELYERKRAVETKRISHYLACYR